QFAEARAQFEEREKQLAYEVSEARRQSAQMDTAVSARLAAQVAEVRRLFEEREQGLAEQVAETRKAPEARDGEGQVPAEAGERIADVDRGAGAVLGQVRGLKERLDSAAAAAKTAQETATSARAAVDELRAGAARVSAELEVGRADIAQAKEEALGAREQ